MTTLFNYIPFFFLSSYLLLLLLPVRKNPSFPFSNTNRCNLSTTTNICDLITSLSIRHIPLICCSNANLILFPNIVPYRTPTRDASPGQGNQDSSQEFQPRKISLLAPFSLGWRDKNKVHSFGNCIWNLGLI